MSEAAKIERIDNQDVSTTVITYTVLHPTSLDPSRMSDVDVANHMTNGEFLGRRESVVTTPVPAENVDAEVEAAGGVKGFFSESGTGPFGQERG